MKHWWIDLIIVTAAFFSMEGVAWFTHKYVMHGLFWNLHRDHHLKEHESFFERNDFFFMIFATPGIACLLAGTNNHSSVLFSIGTGITLYGCCYFFVHDIFIHQRMKILRNANNWYLKAIRRAHKMHHKHTGKEDGECFGMLWVPFKYYKENKRRLV